MNDYSEHTIALAAQLRDISEALRLRRYADADKLCADAMSRLARLHVWIKARSAPIPKAADAAEHPRA